MILGDSKLLYHRSNTRKVTWNTNVGIVNHAQVTHFHWNLGLCASPGGDPKKILTFFFSRSWWPCMFSNNGINTWSIYLEQNNIKFCVVCVGGGRLYSTILPIDFCNIFQSYSHFEDGSKSTQSTQATQA